MHRFLCRKSDRNVVREEKQKNMCGVEHVVRLRLTRVAPDFASRLAEAQPYAPDLRLFRIAESEWKFDEGTSRGYSDVTLVVPERYVIFWRILAAGRMTLEDVAAEWTMGRATHELTLRDKLIPF
ncbi:MAG: hypothetical protein ACOY5F_16370 [Pseudomonadota bacterium]